jgi:hypothetical protein
MMGSRRCRLGNNPCRLSPALFVVIRRQSAPMTGSGGFVKASGRASGRIAEANRMHLILFGIQNRGQLVPKWQPGIGSSFQ